jgi:hypothetical protein
MRVVKPMFHMDPDILWRWYITSAAGKLLAMSVEAFFSYDDAKRNFDEAHAGHWLL